MAESTQRRGVRGIKELPEDLVTDIFICLPVKSLLRFRCVSKRFLALIDGPHFIKRHLNRSLLTKSNHKLILRAFKASPRTVSMYSLDFDELDRAVKIDHPRVTDILGSDNGLLCLQKGLYDIVICNFATRNYHKLPATPIDILGLPADIRFNDHSQFSYGFGYDSVSDDYKLLRLVQFYDDDFDSYNTETKVYSLRSNSWQTIHDCPFYFRDAECYGEIVCGALHWVVYCKLQSDITHFIAAFDLATNDYRVLGRPEFLKKGSFYVRKLDGHLCVPCFSSERADLWVMKNYGVKESWVKLYSVPQLKVTSPFKFVISSKSGTEIMLLQGRRNLLWYSLKEESARKIHLRGCPNGFIPEVYVESLVPLSGKAEDYAKKNRIGKGAKEKQMKGARKRGPS